MKEIDRILIVGAGLGGLTAAGCLLKAGYNVQVFEQAPALTEVGAGIQLSANAMHVLYHLGIGEAISSKSVRPEAYVFRLHDTGEEIQRFALADEHLKLHQAPYNQAHRADLHDALADCVRGLKSDAIQLNKKATGFVENADGVTLQFEDGTTALGDLVIGADGVKSVIRDQICGAVPATYTGDAVWRVTVPANQLPDDFMDKVMAVWLGPGLHAVCYYIRGGDLLNFVGAVETNDIGEESWTAKFPWETFKADFAGWHEDIQTIIDLADRDACYRWALFRRPVVEGWSTGRATILGDAAHATLPYLAQGAAMAIEDGAVLPRALKQADSLTGALDLYERNRRDRTARVVEQSDENRRLFHLKSVDHIRAAFANRDMGADRNGWLYSYNPMTVELT
ncbi:MAG: FAD-dependent monooxygenase [Proteobacteria bacterium]|nr:FAD-dependent monooxygenase [Pseudomonadota bacterium]MDA1325677.1 FAD-dependent monooxygenase [Pseudomonadota bacterium]